ncbi:hypothetical protein [Paenibacillus mesotrionivorans]|uniref:Uncharacterized protein n=1 Tax=Paenibacillus mesotrionivorans TaxID=3160968 RepID=A0ACC7NVI7_9BACL
MTILLLIIAMIFNLTAQYFLKNGVLGFKFEGFDLYQLIKLFTLPSIWIGALLYGGSFLFYILAISRGDLSKISPVSQALTTLGVVAMSVLLFNEPLSLFKIIGILLLVGGTIVIFL